MFRGAVIIQMFKYISATVNAGPFAIPKTKYAIVFCVACKVNLLRPPNGCCRQFFIDARDKFDIVRIQIGGGFP